MSEVFELIKEDGNRIDISNVIPADLQSYQLKSFRAMTACTDEIDMLFQQFEGDGFSIWRSHYFTNNTIHLRGRGDIEVIELCIAIKNHFISSWDGVGQPSLRACQFNFCYAPHIDNKATLYAGQHYETIDFHISLEMLEPFIAVYDELKYFYEKVLAKQPAQLSVECMLTRKMKSILEDIFDLECRHSIYQRMLRARVESFLGLVFESLCRLKPAKKIIISDSLKEKVAQAKIILDNRLFDPIGISELSRLCLSNNFSIQQGFKESYGCTIDEYCQRLRIEMAKKLLLKQDQNATTVATEMGYETLSGFLKFFRKHTGHSPESFRFSKGLSRAKR